MVSRCPFHENVVVDEAYIHFSDTAKTCTDLVAQEKDVVVLRTFSKAYGMAGIRAGSAIARPDLLQKMGPFGGGGRKYAAVLISFEKFRQHALGARMVGTLDGIGGSGCGLQL